MSLAGSMGGPGVLLPPPQSTYPSGLVNADSVPANNKITLAPGQALPIPRGSWMVAFGGNAVLQWLNPVTTVWESLASARDAARRVISDGNNYRVGNFTGCPVGAVVTTQGTIGYATGTTTVTPSTGNSTWLAIVGGMMSATPSITAVGAGYGLPPLVYCPAPPPPGVPATFEAFISSGTVSSIGCINQGAGYTGTTLTLSLVASPYDPLVAAGGAITTATAFTTIVAASGTPSNGKVVCVLCQNPGASLAAPTTLTIAGAGSNAAATPVMMWTATGATIVGAGAGVLAANTLWSVGGITAATPAATNPDVELTAYSPRPFSGVLVQSAGSITSVGTIYDGGLFTGTPTAILSQMIAPTTAPTITFALGSGPATMNLHPLE